MLGSRSENLGVYEEEPTYLEGAGREKLKGKAVVELRSLSKENGVGGSKAARMRAINWIKRKRQTRARSNTVRVKATQHGNGRLVRLLVLASFMRFMRRMDLSLFSLFYPA